MSTLREKNKTDATLKAHATITALYPEVRDWQGLSEILDNLYDVSSRNAAFEHEMAMFSWDLAQRVEEIGHKVVAERLGMTVDEMVERLVHPEDMTMSEVRLFGVATESMIDYKVRPTAGPTKEDVIPDGNDG